MQHLLPLPGKSPHAGSPWMSPIHIMDLARPGVAQLRPLLHTVIQSPYSYALGLFSHTAVHLHQPITKPPHHLTHRMHHRGTSLTTEALKRISRYCAAHFKHKKPTAFSLTPSPTPSLHIAVQSSYFRSPSWWCSLFLLFFVLFVASCTGYIL